MCVYMNVFVIISQTQVTVLQELHLSLVELSDNFNIQMCTKTNLAQTVLGIISVILGSLSYYFYNGTKMKNDYKHVLASFP